MFRCGVREKESNEATLKIQSIWKSGVDIFDVGKTKTSIYGRKNLEFWTSEWRFQIRQ